MKAFQLRSDQITSILAGLIADELARKFGRYTEMLSLSRWNGETKLGRGGINADAEQLSALSERVACYFDLQKPATAQGMGLSLGAWAEWVEQKIRCEQTTFRFHPATHHAGAESRHSAEDIWQDAAAIASLIQGRRRILSMVSPHSVLGLTSTILAPNLLNLETIDTRTLSPDELSGRLQFGDLIVATPTHWRYLADTMPEIPSNVMGLAFGERFGADLATRLRQRGIGAMRELYGSTETGIIAWRDTPPDPFILFDHWRQKEGALVRLKSNGEARQLMPMDEFSWKSENSFSLGKRRDGAVQIGAVNVFPQAIAAIIAEHADIEKCEVRVSRRSGALDRLIADITLVGGKLADQGMAWSVDEWCRARLRPPERPRIYSFVPGEKG